MFDGIELRFTLDEEMGNEIIKEVSREEIYGVLNTIHDDKAPGNSGYSSFFFKFSWNVPGDDFVRAAQFFFQSGKMFKEVNATCIILVPKVESLLSLGDY